MRTRRVYVLHNYNVCTGLRRIRSVETKKAYQYFSSVAPCERRQPCETRRCFNFRPMIFGGRFPSRANPTARFTCALRAPQGGNRVDEGGMGKMWAKKQPIEAEKIETSENVVLSIHGYSPVVFIDNRTRIIK